MMMRLKFILFTICCFLLNESALGQVKHTYSSLLELSDSNPDSCIQLLEKNEALKEQLGSKDHCFLLATSYQNNGKFNMSIAVVAHCLNINSYQNDSDKFFYHWSTQRRELSGY